MKEKTLCSSSASQVATVALCLQILPSDGYDAIEDSDDEDADDYVTRFVTY